MPRQSRGRSAPAPRAAPAPAARAAPAPVQARAPPTAVAPQQHQSNVPAPMAAQSQGPGMMGQIAANAASVAIGSTMARGLSSALGWGGSPAPAAEAQAAPPVDYSNPTYAASTQQAPQQGVTACEPIARDFAKCLEATGNDISPCQYYLDQFKACQAAARPY